MSSPPDSSIHSHRRTDGSVFVQIDLCAKTMKQDRIMSAVQPVRSTDSRRFRKRALLDSESGEHPIPPAERRLTAPFKGTKRAAWQLRTAALITLLAPPAASFVLLAVDYFRYWRDIPFSPGDFLAALFVFAIPVGYAYGFVPALLAAVIYCAVLTADPRLLRRRLLTRACLGAVCGGLASSVWFAIWAGDWYVYGLAHAFVMAALSLRSPSSVCTTNADRIDADLLAFIKR